MSDKPLTAVETSALLILLAEAGPVSNVSLAKDHRCELKKSSREKLVALKLIEVEWVSRRLVLTLSEQGWAHCRTLLAAGSAPPRSGALGGALCAVLRRWDRFLTAQRLSLGEFVTISTPPVVADSRAGDAKPSERVIEERLQAAYQMITPGAGELVSLADLRDRVSDLAPADVDAALRRLHRQRRINLLPEANQKTLDARTRAAAVVIGDQRKHAIEIAAS